MYLRITSIELMNNVYQTEKNVALNIFGAYGVFIEKKMSKLIEYKFHRIHVILKKKMYNF